MVGMRTGGGVGVGFERSMVLEVDTDDPYFFDHPLDHLPGMVLITGVLDLLRSTGAACPEDAGSRMAMALRFPAFSEPAPVLLEAAELPGSGADGAAGRRFAVRARQDRMVVTEGDLTFLPADLARSAGPARPVEVPEYLLPADQALVHRRRRENVLISRVVEAGRTRAVAVRRPPAGHRLAALPGEPLRAEVLLDAARQFGTLLNHTEHQRPADTKFVLLGIDADLPCGPRHDVYLRWTPCPPMRGRARFRLQVVDHPDGTALGQADFEYVAATPSVYEWLRRRGESR